MCVCVCVCVSFPFVQEPDVTYMYDVLEQSGVDMVCASYWDWGDLSDLWTEYLVRVCVCVCVCVHDVPCARCPSNMHAHTQNVEVWQGVTILCMCMCVRAQDVPADVSRCIQLLVSPSREADAKLRLTRLMIELAKTMAVVSVTRCA